MVSGLRKNGVVKGNFSIYSTIFSIIVNSASLLIYPELANDLG